MKFIRRLKRPRGSFNFPNYSFQQNLTLSLLVLSIGSNLGLKFGQEHPMRVLSPHLAERKILK